MSHRAFIYGVINGAMAESSPDRWQRFHRYNRGVIDQLPEQDDFPPLTRSMFAITQGSAVTWQTETMHFGWSANNFADDWGAWLDKFENLLRRLCWWEARLHLEAEIEGCLSCRWTMRRAAIERWFESDPPRLENEWDFEASGDFVAGHRGRV